MKVLIVITVLFAICAGFVWKVFIDSHSIPQIVEGEYRVKQSFSYGAILTKKNQPPFFIFTKERVEKGSLIQLNSTQLIPLRNSKYAYLQKHKVFLYAQKAKYEVLHTAYDESISERVKNILVQTYQRTLGPPYDGLVMGFLFGGDDLLPDSFVQMFRDTGTSHILVVSGFNVALVIVSVSFLLKRAKLKTGMRLLFLLFSIAGYLAITGLEASILRAAFVVSLFLIAVWAHRYTTFANVLLMLIFLIGIFNPFMLLYDISLMLSVMATLGVMAGAKVYEVFLSTHLNSIVGGIVQAIVISCGAYLATLPIVAYYFHSTMFVSPFITLLISPLIPLVMFLGIILLMTWWVPFMNSAIVFFVRISLDTLLDIVSYFASHKELILSVHLSFFGVIISYSILCIIYYLTCLYQKNNNKKYFLS